MEGYLLTWDEQTRLGKLLSIPETSDTTSSLEVGIAILGVLLEVLEYLGV